MSTNPITPSSSTPINDEILKARALELQKTYNETGIDYTSSPIKDNKTGAVFTYKKDPETGEIVCSYEYKEVKAKEILLFPTNTVVTNKARLANLTDAQLEEYKRNHPNSYLSTGYMYGDDTVDKIKNLEKLLDHPDSKIRKNAEKEYERVVAEQLFMSGTVDQKVAEKMAKFIREDAQAGLVAAYTTVYIDKDDFEEAEKALKKSQKLSKDQLKNTTADSDALYEDLKRRVRYIKDKDVRAYINSHKDLFFENGKFSSDKYHAWVKTHLRGDNTLTTSERYPGSIATGLTEKDLKHAARDGNYNIQNDYTALINSAKTVVAIAAPLVVAYMTNHNIKTVSQLRNVIETYANDPDPTKYTQFISAISEAEAVSSVTANFRNVAVRNAFFGALGPAIAAFLDPEKSRDKYADIRTGATIVHQNYMERPKVTEISGNVQVEEPCDDCNADIKRVPVEGKETPEDVKYAPSYFKDTKERSYWYDFVQAYNYDHKQYSIKDIYRAIQRRNGYSAERPNPPSNVMLPLELHDAKGNVIATRKDTYVIPKHPIPQEKGNGKGNAPGGTPRLSKTPGSNKWTVTDCAGKVVGSYNTESEAKAKYKELTGKDFSGAIK